MGVWYYTIVHNQDYKTLKILNKANIANSKKKKNQIFFESSRFIFYFVEMEKNEISPIEILGPSKSQNCVENFPPSYDWILTNEVFPNK